MPDIVRKYNMLLSGPSSLIHMMREGKHFAIPTLQFITHCVIEIARPKIQGTTVHVYSQSMQAYDITLLVQVQCRRLLNWNWVWLSWPLKYLLYKDVCVLGADTSRNLKGTLSVTCRCSNYLCWIQTYDTCIPLWEPWCINHKFWDFFYR